MAKVRKLATVNKDIAKIQSNRQELVKQREQLLVQITANLGGDNVKLEDEYGRIVARVDACDRALNNLDVEHLAARQVEAIADYKTAWQGVKAARVRSQAAIDKRKARHAEVEVEMKALEQEELVAQADAHKKRRSVDGYNPFRDRPEDEQKRIMRGLRPAMREIEIEYYGSPLATNEQAEFLAAQRDEELQRRIAAQPSGDFAAKGQQVHPNFVDVKL